MVKPASCRNMFVKLPFLRPIGGSRQQAFANNIKPEKLLAGWVPQRAFTQCADPIIEDAAHDVAASYAATIAFAATPTSFAVMPGL